MADVGQANSGNVDVSGKLLEKSTVSVIIDEPYPEVYALEDVDVLRYWTIYEI